MTIQLRCWLGNIGLLKTPSPPRKRGGDPRGQRSDPATPTACRLAAYDAERRKAPTRTRFHTFDICKCSHPSLWDHPNLTLSPEHTHRPQERNAEPGPGAAAAPRPRPVPSVPPQCRRPVGQTNVELAPTHLIYHIQLRKRRKEI